MKKHRKLAAIMFTDIVGYTALMSKNEDNALRILQKNRDVVKLLVGQFNGELLKEIGDGNLCCFGSVVDAVNCALEIQNTLKSETEFKLRIGVHVGDVVVEEGGDVFGDGVNVASRIENLAEPGGICISERVYLDIRNKPVLQVACLGEKTLKNVEYPVKVYSLTRGGEEKEAIQKPDMSPRENMKKKTSTYAIIAAAVIIAVAVIGYSLYQRFGGNEEPVEEIAPPVEKAQKPIRSIAVLPFVDMSPEKDQKHLGDGIADMIINKLTKIDSLRVIDRTSSFEFRGKEGAIDSIGKTLNVDAVLEGSVHKYGNQIRIMAQLIKVADHSHFFSNEYDVDFENILAIQDTISLLVLKEMKFTLMGDEKAKFVKRYTTDPGAYELYLQGNEVGINLKAVDLYNQAIEKEPTFALAYTGIAKVYNSLGYENSWDNHIPPKEAFPQARDAVNKALEIDDTLAEAYTQLAWINLYYDWDMQTAEKNIKQALELNPGYSLAHQYYRDYLMILGRHDEAVEKLRKAQSLEPHNVMRTYLLSVSLLHSGRYEEALREAKRAVEMAPQSLMALKSLVWSHSALGNYNEYLDFLPKLEDLGDSSTSVQLRRAKTFVKLGRHDEAERIFKSLLEQYNEHSDQISIAEIYLNMGDYDKTSEWLEKVDEHSSPMKIASIYLDIGDYDKTFEWLEIACEARQSWLVYIKSFTWWEPIRSNPRYKELLKKMGLPED